MNSLVRNVKCQCDCNSRALGRKGNFDFINILKQYLSNHNISYITEAYDYKYYEQLEGSISLDGIKYNAKAFAGAPPFFSYEGNNTFQAVRNEKFVLTNRKDLYIEILGERKRLIEKITRIMNKKEIKAIIFVIQGTKECDLMDIVVPLDNIEINKIKEFRRIPIIAIAEETWDNISDKKIHKIEISQNNCMNNAKHENIIVEFGKREHEICLCAHIDSAFEGVNIEGANDNASGVAVLMELVAKLAKIKEINRRIKCVFYNGEEYNMIGCINMLIDANSYFENHDYEDLFYMIHNGKLKEYITFKAEEIVEIDVVGEGKIINIFTNESATSLVPFFSHLSINGIEKVIIHSGGGSIYYILSKVGYEAKFHLLQLSSL